MGLTAAAAAAKKFLCNFSFCSNTMLKDLSSCWKLHSLFSDICPFFFAVVILVVFGVP